MDAFTKHFIQVFSMTKRSKRDQSKNEKAVEEEIKEVGHSFSTTKPENENSDANLLERETEARLAQVLAHYEAELLRYPNVVGMAQGVRTMGGKSTGEPCIIIYVKRKIPSSKLDKSAILPTQVEGIPVDVVEIGEIVAQ